MPGTPTANTTSSVAAPSREAAQCPAATTDAPALPRATAALFDEMGACIRRKTLDLSRLAAASAQQVAQMPASSWQEFWKLPAAAGVRVVVTSPGLDASLQNPKVTVVTAVPIPADGEREAQVREAPPSQPQLARPTPQPKDKSRRKFFVPLPSEDAQRMRGWVSGCGRILEAGTWQSDSDRFLREVRAEQWELFRSLDLHSGSLRVIELRDGFEGTLQLPSDMVALPAHLFAALLGALEDEGATIDTSRWHPDWGVLLTRLTSRDWKALLDMPEFAAVVVLRVGVDAGSLAKLPPWMLVVEANATHG